MKYTDLDRDWFDAIVTGELTHYALWFEEQLESLILAYFIDDMRVSEAFEVNVLRSRDFTTSKNKKLEFAKALLRGWADARAEEYLSTIAKVEALIALRNAMAHGRDVGGEGHELVVEIQSYGGKTKQERITPETHGKALEIAEQCLEKLKELKRLSPELRKQQEGKTVIKTNKD